MTRNEVRNVIKKHRNTLIKKANVNLVGCGYKIINGKKTNQLSVVVGVAKKIDQAHLMATDIIPLSIDGAPTDVIETGKIVAQDINPRERQRPPMPGISIGHPDVTAGTFGCVVKRNGSKYILSNNHVISNTNNASVGDKIYQPGIYDGGISSDGIAVLEDFIPIYFEGDEPAPPTDPPTQPPTCPIAKGSANVANFAAKTLGRKHRLMAVQLSETTDVSNKVDAAIAYPSTQISDEIVQIGKPLGVAEAEIGMTLQKYGRTTRYTTGEVVMMDAVSRVQYGEGKMAEFTDQIVTRAMSQGGDSGSAVLDMNKNLVGLLFAGSDTVTILNPIDEVFSALNISL